VVNPRGKIPLFVELRRFNELSNEDFTSFIFSITVNSEAQQAKQLFKAAIEEGQFVFIFDGYDEIEPKKRQAVEAAILKLGEHKNIVIVSSRPDEIFHSWQSFTCYETMPFSLEKTSLRDLILIWQSRRSS
jgi:predicted NACHT family NTPase